MFCVCLIFLHGYVRTDVENFMEIIIIKKAAELVKWREKWGELALGQEWNTAFHNIDWTASCMEPDFNEVAVSLVEDKGRLLAAFVICAAENPGSAFLMKTRSVSLEPRIGSVRPGSMIALRDKTAVEIPIADALRKGFDSVSWQTGFFQYCIEREKDITAALKKVADEKKCRIREGFSSPEAFIDIDLPPADYLKSRTPKVRDALRTSTNRLKKLGNYKYAELCEEKRPWDEIVSNIEAVYNKCWQRGSPASPLFPKFRPYIISVMEKFYNNNLLRAWFLYVDEYPIACEIYLVAGKILYPIIKSMDEDYKDISPGNLLFIEGYKYFHALGFKGFYYGPIRASEKTAYKSKWATREWDVPNMALIKKGSLYGMLDYCYHKSDLVKKMYLKLRKNS